MLAFILDIIVIFLVLGMYVSGYELRRIFLGVYLPLLILLPSELFSTIPGLPHTNPAQTAIIVIGGLYIMLHIREWHFGYLDLLILLYAFVYSYSEITAEPSPKGEKTIAVELTVALADVILPYMIAKAFIGIGGIHVAFAQRFVFLVFLVCLVMPYEVRMTYNPFYYLIGKLYPYEYFPPPLFRFGYPRFTGPFNHAILAGTVLATALLLGNWLRTMKFWNKSYLFFIFTLIVIFFAFLATSSRAPFIGILIGFIIASIGYQPKHLIRTFFLRSGVLALALSIIYFVIAPYFDINVQVVSSEAEATLSYRLDLIPLYWNTVMERMWLGWGNVGWPKVIGAFSVDNHYLWLALRHGLITLGLFLLILLIIMFRLLWKGLNLKSTQVISASIIFSLLGILAMQVLIFYTVYMGGQLTTLLFLLIGWGEGTLLWLYGRTDDIPIYSLKYLKMSKSKRALYEQKT